MPSFTRHIRTLAYVCAVALLASGCGVASSQPAPIRSAPMQTMFESQGQLMDAPGPTLDLLRRLGVDQVRVFMPWSSLAPDPRSHARPSGFDASSPSGYPEAAWTRYDAIVRAAATRGIAVDLTLEGGAPLWAEAPGQPGGPAGVWKPSPREYGAFVHAVATRYDGSYTPAGASGAGGPLPRVSMWSIWNEPNYGQQLAPQATDYSTVEISPMLYRGLLDAAWTALMATGHSGDTILIGELAPRGITTGDNPGNFSGMVPLRFMRALYCVDGSFKQLRGAAAAARGCPATASGSASFAKDHPGLFDASALAVHPYPQGGVPPNVPESSEPDYADLPALPNLERTLDRAQAVYGQDRHMPIYSTEFGYQTDPPETISRAINPKLAAFYLNWAEYISWRDPRVASFDQYLLTDAQSGAFATGLLFANGAPKDLYYAFRMPIFLPASSGKRGQPLTVWGCVRPAHYARVDTHTIQTAQIQFRAARSATFHTLKRIDLTDPYGYLDTRVAFPSSGSVRLAWTYPKGETIYSRIASVTLR